MHETVVARKRVVAERTAYFELEPAESTAFGDWSAGAHILVSTSAGPRAYSLIRWPDIPADRYRIAVLKEEEGTGGSHAMHDLEEGAALSVTAPENDFQLIDSAKPTALIAGGIGITPLISMATELARAGREFELHYTGRSIGRMAFVDELKASFGAKVHIYCDDENAIDLRALADGLKHHALYICGPKGMIDAARSAAEAAGVETSDIHVELFTTPAADGDDTAFEVEVASSGQVISVEPDQSIIEALEAAGIDVIYDCTRGDCGICQTDVISGVPDHRDVVLSDAEKASGKVMQICVSRSLSDRLVLDL